MKPAHFGSRHGYGHALNGAENAQGTAGDENARVGGTENTPEQPVLETEFSIGRDNISGCVTGSTIPGRRGWSSASRRASRRIVVYGVHSRNRKPWLAWSQRLSCCSIPRWPCILPAEALQHEHGPAEAKDMKFYPDRFVVLHPSGVAASGTVTL